MRQFIVTGLTLLIIFTVLGCKDHGEQKGKSDEEKCKAQIDKAWDNEEEKCKQADVQESDKVYFITSKLKNDVKAQVTVAGYSPLELAIGECAKITEPQRAKMKIRYDWGNRSSREEWLLLCDNNIIGAIVQISTLGSAAQTDSCGISKDHVYLEIIVPPGKFPELQGVDKLNSDDANCKEMLSL